MIAQNLMTEFGKDFLLLKSLVWKIYSIIMELTVIKNRFKYFSFKLKLNLFKFIYLVELYAHEHSYERLFPIYDYKNLNGSTEEPYRNPRGPVHIVTGSAGCKEIHDPFRESTNISAFRSDDYGYSRMKVYNSTHLHFEQVSVDKVTFLLRNNQNFVFTEFLFK